MLPSGHSSLYIKWWGWNSFAEILGAVLAKVMLEASPGHPRQLFVRKKSLSGVPVPSLERVQWSFGRSPFLTKGWNVSGLKSLLAIFKNLLGKPSTAPKQMKPHTSKCLRVVEGVCAGSLETDVLGGRISSETEHSRRCVIASWYHFHSYPSIVYTWLSGVSF